MKVFCNLLFSFYIILNFFTPVLASPISEVELGKMLFFDPRLSGDNRMSCATCHNPSLGWSDGLSKGVGHAGNILDRRTPTILNVVYGTEFFWDGRASSLEDQALGPIESVNEMNQPLDLLVEELSAIKDYVLMFKQIYPEGLTTFTIAKAIAAFERTVVVTGSPYQKWLAGDDSALSNSAQRGFQVFISDKAHCIHCHSDDNFSDNKYHDIGLLNETDKGKGSLFPNDPTLQFSFKTPGLWGIAQRAPYMHDGSLKTLEEVIDFYNRGGDSNRSTKHEKIRHLMLTPQERSDLLAFLNSLSGEVQLVTMPILPL